MRCVCPGPPGRSTHDHHSDLDPDARGQQVGPCVVSAVAWWGSRPSPRERAGPGGGRGFSACQSVRRRRRPRFASPDNRSNAHRSQSDGCSTTRYARLARKRRYNPGRRYGSAPHDDSRGGVDCSRRDRRRPAGHDRCRLRLRFAWAFPLDPPFRPSVWTPLTLPDVARDSIDSIHNLTSLRTNIWGTAAIGAVVHGVVSR